MSKSPVQRIKPTENDRFDEAMDFSLEKSPSVAELAALEEQDAAEDEQKAKESTEEAKAKVATKTHRSANKAVSKAKGRVATKKDKIPQKPETMRLNADIPYDLYRKVKLAALDRGITVKELLIHLFEEKLD